MLSIKNYHTRHTKLIEKWIELQLNNEYEKSDTVEDEIDKREFNLRKKNRHRGSMTNLRTHVKRCPACNSFESLALLKSNTQMVSDSDSVSDPYPDPDPDKESCCYDTDGLYTRNHTNTPHYCQAMYPKIVMNHLCILEELLRKHEFVDYNQRKFIDSGYSVTLGKTIYNNTSSFTNDPFNRDVIYNMKSIAKYVDPSFRYTSIAINMNAKFKSHRDVRNKSGTLSLIIGFGSYVTGGELTIEDKKYDIKTKFLIFNGKECLHHTEDWSGGDIFSIVFYTV